MLEVLNRFIFFPLVVAFILGFIYYGIWKIVNSTKIWVHNFEASGNSNDVKDILTKALSTAGRGGTSLPLQISKTADTVGMIIPNSLDLYTAAPQTQGKTKLKDANGNAVYAQLGESSNTYTISYFTEVNGTETPYKFEKTTPIDFGFDYRFDSVKCPAEDNIGTQYIS